MRATLVAVAAAVLRAVASADVRSAVLSNTALPVDTNGNTLLTGEVSVMAFNGTWYIFSNNWGGCPGLDCCTAPANNCATCCFNPPTPTYNDTCVYTGNHPVVVYSTTDFTSFQYEGVALGLANRLPGIEFRPQVFYSPPLNKFVMYYEDRWSGQNGYALAASDTPAGPYSTIANTVVMPGPGRVGDFSIFVDTDGSLYHVRTGLTVVKLTADGTKPTSTTYTYSNGGVEGPSMFTAGGVYYLLAGVGCCACRGGSNIEVLTATSPLGPFTAVGDIGSNHTDGHVFSATSPYNYVTRAQGSAVFPVPSSARGAAYLAATGWTGATHAHRAAAAHMRPSELAAAAADVQWVWLGNQWVTAAPYSDSGSGSGWGAGAGADAGAGGGPRNQDLLYWAILSFDGQGNLQQLNRTDSITLQVGL